MLGTIRDDDPRRTRRRRRRSAACWTSTRRWLDNAREPVKLRKLIARTFLRAGRPAEARTQLQAILDRGPDPEAAWLLEPRLPPGGGRAPGPEAHGPRRVVPQREPPGGRARPLRGRGPLPEVPPGDLRDSLASRHTQTYYRGAQLRGLPRPDRPLTDPTDPKVTHAIKEVDGALREETRSRRHRAPFVDRVCVRDERPLPDDGQPRRARSSTASSRLSYYHTPEGQGWDRTILDVIDPARHRGLPGRGDQRARRGHQVPVLPHHLPACRARADRARDGRPRHRLRAMSRTRGHTTRGGRGRPLRPGDRQPRVRLAPGWSRRSSATTATSSTGTISTRRPRKPWLGPLAGSRAGPGAGATPRAAGPSVASPATTPTGAPGRPRPHSTRPNASPATRPRRHGTP